METNSNIKAIYHSNHYIGRTDAFFCDDDDYVFTPDFWAHSDDDNDDEFSAEHEVYELTAEGFEELQSYLEYERMNEYQRTRCGNNEFRYISWNQMWYHLTDNKQFIVRPDKDAIDIVVKVADEYYFESKDDVQHITFADDELQAAYENACDCLYYGDGKSAWIHNEMNEELLDFIWQTAKDTLANDYRY